MADTQQAREMLPCGHHASAVVMSAETGAPLYCEACDYRSRARDAEAREAELLAERDALATPGGCE